MVIVGARVEGKGGLFTGRRLHCLVLMWVLPREMREECGPCLTQKRIIGARVAILLITSESDRDEGQPRADMERGPEVE